MRLSDWTTEAKVDLLRVDDFYAETAPDFADRVGDAAFAAARFLCEFPFAGSPIGLEDARKWRVQATPYILIYRPLGETIQILRVRHRSEDWKRDFE